MGAGLAQLQLPGTHPLFHPRESKQEPTQGSDSQKGGGNQRPPPPTSDQCPEGTSNSPSLRQRCVCITCFPSWWGRMSKVALGWEPCPGKGKHP